MRLGTRLLARTLVLMIAFTILGAIAYSFPQSIQSFFVVYEPAWLATNSLTSSYTDFPASEFFFAFLIQNFVVALVISGLWEMLRATKRALTSARSDHPPV
ncbi:MAG: hypothetical protein KJ747_00465 [Actinobacteria bacterium]|nr:hypothetical protein [Actinomycetota bacterium]